MTEIFTYSSTVDDIVLRAKRPARRNDIERYLNNTIREIAVLSYFYNDLIEDQITATAQPHLWTKPDLHRVMRTVYYPSQIVWPDFIPPGRKQEGESHYYYGSGPTQFVFKGIEVDENIDIAYYTYPRYFKYYAATGNVRPAIYDDETEAWTYLSGGSYVADLGTPELNQAAEDKVTNWILQRWLGACKEGTFAKVFKILEEETRARSAFALYKSNQTDILKGEQHETLDF